MILINTCYTYKKRLIVMIFLELTECIVKLISQQICYIMGKVYESLKKYFEETPKEILDKDWEAIKYLNNIGPDVEYLEQLRNG